MKSDFPHLLNVFTEDYQIIDKKEVKVQLRSETFLEGKLIAIDKFFNMILKDCEEFKLIIENKEKEIPKNTKKKIKTHTRLFLKGDNVISISTDDS